MTPEQCRYNLCYSLPYLLLRYILLLLLKPFDELCHVPPLAVLHHYVYLGLLFIYYAVVVSDYVRVMQLPKYVDLAY